MPRGPEQDWQQLHRGYRGAVNPTLRQSRRAHAQLLTAKHRQCTGNGWREEEGKPAGDTPTWCQGILLHLRGRRGSMGSHRSRCVEWHDTRL